MSGETDLKKILQNMAPEKQSGAYVFCTLAHPDEKLAEHVIGYFREKEGITYILTQETADKFSLQYDGLMAWITLQVHSSLEAVGLTAAVSGVLAEAGISCNVVAAYYHDHLFVPLADAGQAVAILQELGRP